MFVSFPELKTLRTLIVDKASVGKKERNLYSICLTIGIPFLNIFNWIIQLILQFFFQKKLLRKNSNMKNLNLIDKSFDEVDY